MLDLNTYILPWLFCTQTQILHQCFSQRIALVSFGLNTPPMRGLKWYSGFPSWLWVGTEGALAKVMPLQSSSHWRSAKWGTITSTSFWSSCVVVTWYTGLASLNPCGGTKGPRQHWAWSTACFPSGIESGGMVSVIPCSSQWTCWWWWSAKTTRESPWKHTPGGGDSSTWTVGKYIVQS